jgi:hypothetical protein
MKNIHRYPVTFSLFLVFTLLLASCKKENSASSPGTRQVKIFLTDGPARFDAVNIDIMRVEVWTLPDCCRDKRSDDRGDEHEDDHDEDSSEQRSGCGKWDTLSIRPGVYNLLNLSNGTDTLLATGYTPAGAIRKVRITLGDHNTVVADSVSYPLYLHSNHHQIIIKPKDDEFENQGRNNLQLWLDFDAGHSIIKEQDNHFYLRPSIHLFTPGSTAAIEGRVQPAQANAIVSTISNGDTLVAMPRLDGYFKIRGIRSATANLFVNATANGYADTTLNSIQLHPGKETNIGTVTLHQ